MSTENGRGSRDIEDYLGIIWPTERLSPEIIAKLVVDSKSKPLRELVAEIIIWEADSLHAHHKAMHTNVRNGGLTNVDFSINSGYRQAGKGRVELVLDKISSSLYNSHSCEDQSSLLAYTYFLDEPIS